MRGLTKAGEEAAACPRWRCGLAEHANPRQYSGIHHFRATGCPQRPVRPGRGNGTVFLPLHRLRSTPARALWSAGAGRESDCLRLDAIGITTRARLRVSLVRCAPARVPDDLRELPFALPSAGALRLTGAALLVEYDDLVVERDVPLRPAQHLDRRCELAAGFARKRLDPTQDLHAFVGDPAVALPPLRHARPPPPLRSAPRAPDAMRATRAACARPHARLPRRSKRKEGGRGCAWPPSGSPLVGVSGVLVRKGGPDALNGSSCSPW